ncbi:MAG: hypothetical protein AABY22_29865 [Nanoarchaeota archaeon]
MALKDIKKMQETKKIKLSVPATRYCPECDRFGLEITEDLDKYECKICGSIWRRIKPINLDGKMVDMPDKLKKLLKEN